MDDKRKQFVRAAFAVVVLLFTALGPPPAFAPSAAADEAAGWERSSVSGQLLVTFRDGSSSSERRRAHSRAGARVLRRYEPLSIELVQVEDGDERRASRRYRAQAGVLDAEPNLLAEPFATFPDDEKFAKEWGLHNTGQVITGSTSGVVDADVDAPEAWDVTTGSKSVKVAIVDTGMQVDHPDLQGNVGERFNASSGGSDVTEPPEFADGGHGTHVGGTVGAVGGNGIGVTGVNWAVTLLPVKFNFSLSDAIDGMMWARDRGAKVINASWGGDGSCPTSLANTLDSLNSSGVLLVAAAGNDGVNIDQVPHWPAACANANVIAVAATDYRDQRASFSNYGPTRVHLGAPGRTVASTYPTYYSGSTGYAFMSGTSMAAPHVAGAAALVWAAKPSLSAAQVKQRLMDTADPLTALSGKTVSGGRLNVARAAGVEPDAAPSPTPTPTTTPAPTATPAPTPTPSPSAGPSAWTRVEEWESSVGYDGAWYATSAGGASGGSFRRAYDAGATATFSFSGTGVRWVGHRDSIGGVASVYLDGVYRGDVDLSGSAGWQQVLFERTGLSSGAHVLRVEVTSKRPNRFVYVDAFERLGAASSPSPTPPASPTPTPPASPTPTPSPTPSPTPTPTASPVPGGWVRVEESGVGTSYSGFWFDASYQGASGGSFRRSYVAGSAVEFSFSGTGVRWVGHRDSIGGVASVYLDGVYRGDVDLSGSTGWQQVLFERTGLSSGAHVLRVEVTSKRPNRFVYVDAFERR